MAKVQRTIQVSGDPIQLAGGRIATSAELNEILHAHLSAAVQSQLQPGEQVVGHTLDKQTHGWVVTVESGT